MIAKNQKELFVMLLQRRRHRTPSGRPSSYQEISQAAQDPDIKEALESRAWIAKRTWQRSIVVSNSIREQPVKLSGRLQEVFVEDFRRELAEIQNPIAKHMFVLAKVTHLVHLRIAEYVALVAAADVRALCRWCAARELPGRQGRVCGKNATSHPELRCDEAGGKGCHQLSVSRPPEKLGG